MKKTNNKVSKHKIKRALKNKKRIQDKPYLSKSERKLIAKRQEIIAAGLRPVPN